MDWQKFLKSWRKKHPEIPYRTAQKEASKEYQQKKKTLTKKRTYNKSLSPQRRIRKSTSPTKKRLNPGKGFGSESYEDFFPDSKGGGGGRRTGGGGGRRTGGLPKIKLYSGPYRPSRQESEDAIRSIAESGDFDPSEAVGVSAMVLASEKDVIQTMLEAELQEKYPEFSVPEGIFNVGGRVTALEVKRIAGGEGGTGYTLEESKKLQREKESLGEEKSGFSLLPKRFIPKTYRLNVDKALKSMNFTTAGDGKAPEQQVQDFHTSFVLKKGDFNQTQRKILEEDVVKQIDFRLPEMKSRYPKLENIHVTFSEVSEDLYKTKPS